MLLTTTQNDIAERFFLNFKTGSEISREKYPDSTRKKNVGIVSSLLSKFKKNGWIETRNELISKVNKKGTKYKQKIPHYRLNLNFFFDYSKEKGVKFNEEEKKFLEFVFSYKNIREGVVNYEGNLIEGLKYVLRQLTTKIFTGALHSFGLFQDAYIKEDPENIQRKILNSLKNIEKKIYVVIGESNKLKQFGDIELIKL